MNLNKKSKKFFNLVNNIEFEFEKLIKFKNYNILEKKLNFMNEEKFDENFIILKTNYFNNYNNTKFISSIFANEILLEILKFLDLETLISKVKIFFFKIN